MHHSRSFYQRLQTHRAMARNHSSTTRITVWLERIRGRECISAGRTILTDSSFLVIDSTSAIRSDRLVFAIGCGSFRGTS